MIEPTSGHAVQAVGGRLYAIGGEQVRLENVLALSQAYDPVRDEWTLVAPPPIPIHAAGNAVMNDSIYLFGGTSVIEASSTGIDRVFRFDPPIVQAPKKLKVRVLKSGDIKVKWKFKPGKSDATEIEVQIRAGNRAFATAATVDTRTKTLIATDLKPGAYTFRARSNGPSGTSAWSTEVSAKVPR